jgi:MFS family permease
LARRDPPGGPAVGAAPGARPEGRPRLYYGWVLVAALGVITIVTYGTSQYLFGLLVLPAGRDLGAARGQISGAYSLGLVVAGLLGVPVGRFVDRHGARPVLMLGSAVSILSLIGLSRVRSLLWFYALWAGGNGFAMALTLYPVTFVVVANWFERRRGSAMGLLTMIGGLSSPIFTPLTGWLIAGHGWRTALLLLALAQAAMLPVEAALVRRRPEDLGLHPDGLPPAAGAPSPETGADAGGAFRRPAFWLLTLAGSAGLLAANALLVHQVPYMTGRGLDPVLAASVAGLGGLASVPGRALLYAPRERVAPQRLLTFSFAAMGLATVMLLLARSAALFVAYAVVFGVGYGTVNPLRALAMADHFGRRAFGAITAAQNLAAVLSAAAGPILAGGLYDLTGSYRPALIAVAAACLLAALATAAAPAPDRP